jgi:hypothetical protein
MQQRTHKSGSVIDVRFTPDATKLLRISEMTRCADCVCKSLFAPLIVNFSSCRRGFRVNMWGTSSPGDKLTGDFGNKPDATSISDRGLFRLLAGNLSPGVFGLLQHNRHRVAVPAAPTNVRSWGVERTQRGHAAMAESAPTETLVANLL